MILKLATYFFYVQSYKMICRHAIVEVRKKGHLLEIYEKVLQRLFTDITDTIPTHYLSMVYTRTLHSKKEATLHTLHSPENEWMSLWGTGQTEGRPLKGESGEELACDNKNTTSEDVNTWYDDICAYTSEGWISSLSQKSQCHNVTLSPFSLFHFLRKK